MSDFSDAAALMDDALLATLGDTLTYTRQSDSVSAAVAGVFTSGGQFEDAHAGAKASILFRLDDLSAYPAKGDTVTFNSKVYAVAEDPRHGEDGQGGITLQLRFVRNAP